MRTFISTFFRPYTLPALAGLLFSLTLPTVGMTFLAPIALVPFLVFLSRPRRAREIIFGTVIMQGIYATLVVAPLFHLSGWWWPVGSESVFFFQSALVAGILLSVSFLWALAFVPFSFLYQRYRAMWGGGVIFALLFTGTEFVRTAIFLYGHTWGLSGYALLSAPYIHFVATLGGVYALSFFVGLFNVTVARLTEEYIWRRRSHPEKRSSSWFTKWFARDGVFVLGIFLITFFYGYIHSGNLPCVPQTNVAVIGSSIETDEPDHGLVYASYKTILAKELARNPDIILLPENAFPFFEIVRETGEVNPFPLVGEERAPALYADFLALSRKYGATTIAVGLHTISLKKRYNSLVFYRNGKVVGWYDKRHLLPGAEYTPALFPFTPFVSFEGGTSSDTVNINSVRIAGLICSEVATPLPRTAHPQIILSPSNDSVFAGVGATETHHAMARMRALEHGAYVLRAVRGGVTSIIAPDGSVVAESEGGVIRATIGGDCGR